LATLAALGFAGLTEHPDFYGDGIALGSGAVTLYELVQAYTALANGGVARPLTVLADDPATWPLRRVFSAESASLIGNVLSDADARALEFGRDSVLAFPVQTAVKTGTSSDFRDAWAVGYDHRYVAGVWIGNLDQRPSEGVTGSTGPALVLRGVFAQLARGTATRPLYLSRTLERVRVCVPVPLAATEAGCVEREEWFRPGTAPRAGDDGGATQLGDLTVDARRAAAAPRATAPRIRLRQPTPGLALAFDPRLPADAQAFEFALDGIAAGDRVHWHVDGREHVTANGRLLWPVTRGEHDVVVSVWRNGTEVAALDRVSFAVR
jgi:penicillin-binding protein 1C